MNKIISYLSFILLLFASVNVFAQNISTDVYRTATSKEMRLHDDAYNILQHEIETNICDNNWYISQKPFLISSHPDRKIVIVNYLKGVGNIPVFTKEDEKFEIKMNIESPLYQAYIDENKKQTEAFQARSANISTANKQELALIKKQNEQYFKYINQSANRTTYGTISLELNQSQTVYNEGDNSSTKSITVPGIHQGAISITLPDENSTDTIYNTILYIGKWPKLSGSKMLSFHFIKNTGSGPVIENMIIGISTFNHEKMMKLIYSIDWTKLEALI